MVRSRPNEDMTQILEELSDFLRENNQKPVSSKLFCCNIILYFVIFLFDPEHIKHGRSYREGDGGHVV